jgi:hypothetical protein
MDDHESACHICFKELTGGHKCQTCKKFVHLLCGKPVGEEGYGQKVICFKCKNTGKTVKPYTFLELIKVDFYF